MSSALQVSFRGFPPTEALVAIAAEGYRTLKRERPHIGECMVTIAAAHEAQRTLAHAIIRLGDIHTSHLQHAEAKHSDPKVALRRALGVMRARLALPAGAPDPRWLRPHEGAWRRGNAA